MISDEQMRGLLAKPDTYGSPRENLSYLNPELSWIPNGRPPLTIDALAEVVRKFRDEVSCSAKPPVVLADRATIEGWREKSRDEPAKLPPWVCGVKVVFCPFIKGYIVVPAELLDGKQRFTE